MDNSGDLTRDLARDLSNGNDSGAGTSRETSAASNTRHVGPGSYVDSHIDSHQNDSSASRTASGVRGFVSSDSPSANPPSVGSVTLNQPNDPLPSDSPRPSRRLTAISRRDADDVVLVAGAQRGERDALDQLLHRHYDRVFAICRRITNNEADAFDAAQHALLSITRGIGKFDGTSSFTTWMHRVATNAALDELRRRKRRPEPHSFDETPPQDGQRPTTRLAGKNEVGFERSEDRSAIDAALEKIPPEFRSPVVLRDLCGLDYAEIAEVLKIPPGTVRSRIARGRAALAPLLASYREGQTGSTTGGTRASSVTDKSDSLASRNQAASAARRKQHDV